MQAITEIKRIEADLYRFIQTASQPYRWIKDYLGPIGLFDSHVTAGEFDEVESSLKNTDELLEQEKQSVKDCEAVIQKIATALHGIIGNPSPDFPMILQHIASVIHDGDHTILLDDDAVCDAIDEVVALRPSAPATPPEIQTLSPENQPQTNENQNNTIVRPHRRLPDIRPGAGQRAA